MDTWFELRRSSGEELRGDGEREVEGETPGEERGAVSDTKGEGHVEKQRGDRW